MQISTDRQLTPTTIWQHYEGNQYQIIAIAKSANTHQEQVVCRNVADYSEVWTYPKEVFLETLSSEEGTNSYRFTKLAV